MTAELLFLFIFGIYYEEKPITFERFNLGTTEFLYEEKGLWGRFTDWLNLIVVVSIASLPLNIPDLLVRGPSTNGELLGSNPFLWLTLILLGNPSLKSSSDIWHEDSFDEDLIPILCVSSCCIVLSADRNKTFMNFYGQTPFLLDTAADLLREFLINCSYVPVLESTD